ncbi:unnamed protein product [Paramecium octaurelia]|uniref:Serine aminopeptidase S33 domain-containing protein n=1 Tax=Paramecium octaurelia TaxID=43137 RepID=A0A8S1V5W1_PAROT|nr:unnamed protein product [Paramecium octaurelia]
MELNFMIFPIPKNTYREGDLKELIKIPYYEDIFKLLPTSPKTKIQFHKMHPFKPPDDIPPQDVSTQSMYDDQVDELPTQRIPHITQTTTLQPKPPFQTSRCGLRLSISPRVSFNNEALPPTLSNRSCKSVKEIPCLYLKSYTMTKRTIIYFHANCEDLKSSYNLVDFLRHNMRMNILAVEYPGYGIYQGEPSEEVILKDAEYIYKYMAFHSGVEEQNIILMGRSIGTGVACHVASVFRPATLVLISPFLSLQEIVQEKYPLLRKMLKERFTNKDKILRVKCPLYILHGLKDSIVSAEQAKKLYDLCKSPCMIRTPPEMTHTRFQFEQDLSLPLLGFMRQLNIL